jgi:soluble lytic murein transglycosylase
MRIERTQLTPALSLILLLPILVSAGNTHTVSPKRVFVQVPPPHYVEVSEFLASRRIRLEPAEIKVLTRTILDESRRAKIEPRLILGLIHVESSGNPRAVSKVGALGLMQLRPDTAVAMAEELGIEWDGPESLFDPNLNVRLGVRYLARMIDRFGDLDVALAAYNFGPTRIARVIRTGRPVPVRYATDVHRAYLAS